MTRGVIMPDNKRSTVAGALRSMQNRSNKLNEEHKAHHNAKKPTARQEPTDHWYNPKLNEGAGIVPNVRS